MSATKCPRGFIFGSLLLFYIIKKVSERIFMTLLERGAKSRYFWRLEGPDFPLKSLYSQKPGSAGSEADLEENR